MVQYIDKDALVAEIVKMLQEEYPCDNSEQTTGYHCALYELQDFLNSLEVKEWDLEKELNVIIDSLNDDKYEHLSIHQQLSHIAKHFYELGLKAQKGE